MNAFEQLRCDMNELIRRVRISERYLTAIAANPKLATDETHAKEIERARRMCELSARLGVSA